MNCPKPLCEGSLRTVTESETGYDYFLCDRCSTRFGDEELSYHEYVTECIDWLKRHNVDVPDIIEQAEGMEANDELLDRLNHVESWEALTAAFWRTDNNGVLDNLVLTHADSRLPERPSALKRADAAGDIATSLPDKLTERFLQSTLDIYGTDTGDLHDMEFQLRMEQLFALHTNRVNDRERRILWDEVLKYTQYRFEAKWVDNDEDTRMFTEEAWKQNATPWRNGILTDKIASHHDTVDMKYVHVTPIERREPQFEPLDDLAWFVYYDEAKPQNDE